MKDKYNDLYKRLMISYYNGNFEKTLHDILTTEFEDKEEGKKVLANLCGVSTGAIEDDYLFIYEIIDSLTQKKVKEKLVEKVSGCVEDCESIDGKSKCQSVCPFDAIIKDSLTKEKWIDEDLCMGCGRCIQVCDKGKYLGTSDAFHIGEIVKENDEVIAIVAPAISGQFGDDVTLDMLREAFIKIGFIDMVEVAMAADILSIKEAIEFKEHVHSEGDFMITSCCCPVWITMLKKIYNDLIPDVSPSVSPMIAMGRIIKAMNDKVKVVFIGPCLAKKAEAKDKDLLGAIDYVLTFEELKTIFEVLKIDPKTLKGVPSIEYASRGGRLYARAGGVSEAVNDIVDQLFPEKRDLFTKIHVDGIKECRAILKDLQEGRVKASFIEGMGCTGGCVGGPKKLIDAEKGREAANKVAYDSAIKIPVHSKILIDILNKLGMNDIEDFKKQCSMFERNFKK